MNDVLVLNQAIAAAPCQSKIDASLTTNGLVMDEPSNVTAVSDAKSIRMLSCLRRLLDRLNSSGAHEFCS